MRTLAWILGIIGFLCGVMGVVVALNLKVIGQYAGLTWSFWFGAAIVLLLCSIASALGARSGEE